MSMAVDLVLQTLYFTSIRCVDLHIDLYTLISSGPSDLPEGPPYSTNLIVGYMRPKYLIFPRFVLGLVMALREDTRASGCLLGSVREEWTVEDAS